LWKEKFPASAGNRNLEPRLSYHGSL